MNLISFRRILVFFLLVALSTAPWAVSRTETATDSTHRNEDPSPATEMVLVPAGLFLMGSDPSDPMADPDERPRHQLALDAFYIDRTEVTYRHYQLFLYRLETVGHAACHEDEPKNKDHRTELPLKDLGDMEHPIVGIDWYDAHAYCSWAGKRLPSEAEWEKAARGTDGRLYPWGSEWHPSFANANGTADGFVRSAPVGSFPDGASPYGALDMAGNAREWVADSYHRSSLHEPQADRAVAPEWGYYRIVRGGSWLNHLKDLRAAERSKRTKSAPVMRYLDVGFRCATNATR